MKGETDMKSWLSGRRKTGFIRIVCLLVVIVMMGGAGAALELKITGASAALNSSIASPTPPSDNTIGLSPTSGIPGTHVFIAGSGYMPGEIVQPIWNYSGPGTGVIEKSFYYFNPTSKADVNGVVNESIFVPANATKAYTIAAKGLTSNIVKTAVFQLTSSIETGIFIGNPGTVLRLRGWSFGAKETVSMYWNWNAGSGQLIGTATTDKYGSFSKRTFTVPITAPGVYTVAAVGAISQATALTQFTVGTPNLNGQQNASDWTNFGYDLQGTRVNPTETIIGPSNAANLAVKWKSAYPLPGKVTGSPVIANGIAYVGTIQGLLVAFDIASGNILWTFAAKGPVYGSATVQNGIAYFGSVNYPGEGLIGNYAYALNATDGSLIWENYLDYGADWVDPLVSNGRVIFPGALKEAISGGMIAFDAYTGATIWGFSTPYGIWSTPTVDPSGTNLYVNTGNPCLGTGGTGCSGRSLEIDAASGGIIWQNQLPDFSGDDDIATTATYSNGKIYLGSKNGIFYCMDAASGTILWQYNTGKSGDSGIFSSAAFYNGLVYFGGGDQRIHALNASDGSLAWTFTPKSSITWSSPAEANGVVYSGSGDKNVYAFDATTGTRLWNFRTGLSVLSSPAISNGVLYVSGSDGYFYAFSLGGL